MWFFFPMGRIGLFAISNLKWAKGTTTPLVFTQLLMCFLRNLHMLLKLCWFKVKQSSAPFTRGNSWGSSYEGRRKKTPFLFPNQTPSYTDENTHFSVFNLSFVLRDNTTLQTLCQAETGTKLRVNT